MTCFREEGRGKQEFRMTFGFLPLFFKLSSVKNNLQQGALFQGSVS